MDNVRYKVDYKNDDGSHKASESLNTEAYIQLLQDLYEWKCGGTPSRELLSQYIVVEKRVEVYSNVPT